MTTSKKCGLWLAGAVLLIVSGLGAAACGGPTVDGQHDSCDKDADCPTGHNFVCLADADGNKSCEIPCDPTLQVVDQQCPLEENCETETAFPEPVCYELPA
jgi:hypothetical protein